MTTWEFIVLLNFFLLFTPQMPTTGQGWAKPQRDPSPGPLRQMKSEARKQAQVFQYSNQYANHHSRHFTCWTVEPLHNTKIKK